MNPPSITLHCTVPWKRCLDTQNGPITHHPLRYLALYCKQVSPRKCEVVFDYFLEERCIQEKIEHGKASHAALEE